MAKTPPNRKQKLDLFIFSNVLIFTDVNIDIDLIFLQYISREKQLLDCILRSIKFGGEGIMG